MKSVLFGDVATRRIRVLHEVHELAAGQYVRVLADLIATWRKAVNDAVVH